MAMVAGVACRLESESWVWRCTTTTTFAGMLLAALLSTDEELAVRLAARLADGEPLGTKPAGAVTTTLNGPKETPLPRLPKVQVTVVALCTQAPSVSLTKPYPLGKVITTCEATASSGP